MPSRCCEEYYIYNMEIISRILNSNRKSLHQNQEPIYMYEHIGCDAYDKSNMDIFLVVKTEKIVDIFLNFSLNPIINHQSSLHQNQQSWMSIGKGCVCMTNINIIFWLWKNVLIILVMLTFVSFDLPKAQSQAILHKIANHTGWLKTNLIQLWRFIFGSLVV